MIKPSVDNYFYVSPENVTENSFCLQADEYIHASKALRVKPGEIIVAVDGNGTEILGEVKEVSTKDKEVRCAVIKKRRRPNEPLTDTILIQAVIKGDRFDYFVEKAVEIGVNRIIPVITERCIVKPSPQKTRRWRRVALAAMKQSWRSVLPVITDTQRWQDIFSLLPSKHGKIILQGDGAKTLHDYLSNASGAFRKSGICIAVGPEGDFIEEEAAEAVRNGFTKVTLGPRRLRSETAGISALSIILSKDQY